MVNIILHTIIDENIRIKVPSIIGDLNYTKLAKEITDAGGRGHPWQITADRRQFLKRNETLRVCPLTRRVQYKNATTVPITNVETH